MSNMGAQITQDVMSDRELQQVTLMFLKVKCVTLKDALA